MLRRVTKVDLFDECRVIPLFLTSFPNALPVLSAKLYGQR